VSFPSADGTRLSGWFIPARGLADARTARGTVIQFHGNAQNLTSHWRSVDWLPDRGFNLFVFDYRGYGASAGVPSPQGVFENSRSALDYVRSRADLDPRRLLVLGPSLGGANAIAVVGSDDREGVRAVVIESAFASYSSIANDKLPSTGLLADDAFSPDRFVAGIAPIPLLLIHGADDQVIPLAHSERLFQLAGDPKRLILVPGGRHADAFSPRFGLEYKDLVANFFDSALAAHGLLSNSALVQTAAGRPSTFGAEASPPSVGLVSAAPLNGR